VEKGKLLGERTASVRGIEALKTQGVHKSVRHANRGHSNAHGDGAVFLIDWGEKLIFSRYKKAVQRTPSP